MASFTASLSLVCPSELFPSNGCEAIGTSQRIIATILDDWSKRVFGSVGG